MKFLTRHFFELVDLQARMALKAEASRLLLSYAWWIIEPILFVAVFYFVFGVLLRTGSDEFLLFLVCGKIPFMWFSKSVTIASNSIYNNRLLIMQTDVPKIFFPLASVHQSLYREAPVFGLMLLVTMAFGNFPQPVWLMLVPLILIQYVFILGASCLGAVLVARLVDTRNLISLGMLFLMFSSGVFWDVARIGDPELRELVLWANPIAFLLDAYRKVLMHGELYNLLHLYAVGIASITVFAGAAFWLNFQGRKVAAWIINS